MRVEGIRVVMLLENNPYSRDSRVRLEAESLVAAGYHVRVVAPRARGERAGDLVGGVLVRRFRVPEGRGLLGFLLEYLVAAIRLHAAALVELLRGAEVLHLHNPPDILFGAGALFRLAGRKVIFDHHDLFPEAIESKLGTRAFTPAALVCERFTFRVANHVLATNESVAELARTRGGKHADAVTVVRNGPPEAWTRSTPTARSGPLSSIKLAYLGAMSTQDGVETLASVLTSVLARGLDATLTIVGDGDARAALEACVRRNGLAERVTVTGWVPYHKVPELLGSADVCLDPAPATPVNDRSTMIKVAEYLALGKPVVAFDLRETRRTAGDAALLIAPGDIESFADAIVKLARDPGLRIELAKRACERAHELVWTHSAGALVSAYAQVLGTYR
jgi:glycosyltransferase involved in cell wall biosynthesis